MSIGDLLDAAIAVVPERAALIIDDAPVSYGALGAAVSSAAAVLSARGVGPGDRVALIDSTGVLAVATVIGCARLGAAAVPMSTQLTASEIANVARAAGCGPVAVAGADRAVVVERALGARPLGESILTGDARDIARPVSDDDPAVVILTSGTTGVPKPIPLSHRVLGRRMQGYVVAPDPANTAVSIVCVPFHHVAGLVGVFLGLAGGNTSVVQKRFDAGEWLRLVERHHVQRVFLVPTMLHRILDHPDFTRTDLTSLQMITYGAAPASADLVARAVDALPRVGFIQVFGQTETLGAVTALLPEDQRLHPGSVGKPMPGVDIRIVDAMGSDVADGEIGEFWTRAPYTATEGWVRTGDLVRRDAEGYLYAAGRLSDVINRGGEKIDPAEVEDALRLHPAVQDAGVCSIPDGDLGERVGAVVVARDRITADALREWCRARIASFKVPERFLFVNQLPLTELGKVSRRQLRALFED